jgi:lipoate-protein ligase A
LFHDTLQEILTDGGFQAWQPCKCAKPASGVEPFLCFQRRSAYDILVGDTKIVGSAQRRRRSGILQHGSLLLETSSRAPELAGLTTKGGAQKPAEADFVDLWPSRLAEALHLEFVSSPLLDYESRQAGELVREKFGSDVWNKRR